MLVTVWLTAPALYLSVTRFSSCVSRPKYSGTPLKQSHQWAKKYLAALTDNSIKKGFKGKKKVAVIMRWPCVHV